MRGAHADGGLRAALFGRRSEGERHALREGGTSAGGGGAQTAPAVLIVSSRHRLWQRYGDDGLYAIERAVGDLVGAMAQRGLVGTLAYVDDSPLLSTLGILPATPGRADEAARVVRELALRMRITEEDARYVLLLGDDGVLPFHRLANPSLDDEEEVLSDHPYAVAHDDPLRPVRAVGRIPDAGLDMLLAALRAACAGHRRAAGGRLSPLAPSAFGYSASIWKRSARGAYSALDGGSGRGLRLSPPLTRAELPHPGPDGPRFRYYNLHGLSDAAEWFGQRDPAFPADYPEFPIALGPDEIEPAPGSVVFSEACFGAHIQGRARHDSVALTHLAGGALAFVGATGVAYGGLDGDLLAADLLAYRFWQAIRFGEPAGEALASAKTALLTQAMESQGYVDAEDEKAVSNFVLFGDPSLAHADPAEEPAGKRSARTGPGTAGSAAPVGEPPIRPCRTASGQRAAGMAIEGGRAVAHRIGTGSALRGVPGDSELRIDSPEVARAREVIAKRIPAFGSDTVVVRVAPVGGTKGCAKSGPGAPGAHGTAGSGATVVTLSKSASVCTGPVCRSVVRVTLDGRGEVARIAVSHG